MISWRIMGDMADKEELRERNLLAKERLISLEKEREIYDPYGEYFRRGAGFLLRGSYEDLKPERYDTA